MAPVSCPGEVTQTATFAPLDPKHKTRKADALRRWCKPSRPHRGGRSWVITQNYKTEVYIMAAVERKIPGTFSKVPGGYEQRIDESTTIFVPDMCASSFIPETGELHGYAPDYDALEAAKSPAIHADRPGEYSYCYEMDHAPTGCDFSADLAYYGNHYFLYPLRDDLPRLRGRGITYNESNGTYKVTLRAYAKLKEQYKIKRETYLD